MIVSGAAAVWQNEILNRGHSLFSTLPFIYLFIYPPHRHTHTTMDYCDIDIVIERDQLKTAMFKGLIRSRVPQEVEV